MITPLFNGILFIFADDFRGGLFQEKTDWGFEVRGDHSNTSKEARWGKVVAVGPDVSEEDVQKGNYIYIEPLMWTKGIVHDGVNIWKTDLTKVMLVSEEIPTP
jgi:hypothetical protein